MSITQSLQGLPTFDTTIDKVAGRLRVPKDVMGLMGWKVEPGSTLTFELMERGRARLHLGDYLEKAIAAATAKQDERALVALPMILHCCTWESANRTNAVPRPVRFHILETGEITGALHAAAAAKHVELWSEAFRLRRLTNGRSVTELYLPE